MVFKTKKRESDSKTTMSGQDAMIKHGQLIFGVFSSLSIVFIIYLCVAPLIPPTPLSENVAPSIFSAERAMRHIEAISQEAHPIGTPELASVRDYILGELKTIGLNPSIQNTFATRHSGDVLFSGRVSNIIARHQGTESEGAILLMAHYDTVSTSPGAMDSGSGVSVLLEMMRVIGSMEPLKNDVIALFTDGEESALLGAQAFIDEHAFATDVKIVLNMGLLYQGPVVIWTTSSENGWLITEWARSVSDSASSSSPFSAFMSGDTDLTPFLKAGISGFHFLTAFSLPYYHTAGERPERISPASIQHIGSQITEFVRHLGNSNIKNTKGSDKVYFHVMGVTLHYPVSWVMPLTIVVSIFYSLILITGIRRNILRWRGIGIGMCAFLISMVASGGFVMFMFWIVLRAHPEYSLNPHVLIKLWQPHFRGDSLYLIGFIALAASITFIVNNLLRKKAWIQELTIGMLFFWLIGAVVASIQIPPSSYLFHWPILVSLVALVLVLLAKSKQKEKIGWGTAFLSLLTVISALVLWVPLIYMFFLWTTYSLLAVLIGLVVLALGAMIPFMELYQFHKRWITPIVFLIIGFSFLIAGHFLAYSQETIKYANHVGYWLDGDSKKANWVTTPGKLDQRQKKLFQASSMVAYSEIHPLGNESKTVLASPAPVAPMQAPVLFVRDDRYQDNKRILSIHINSPQNERLEVYLKPEPERLVIHEESEKGKSPKTYSLVDDGGWAYVRFDALQNGLNLELHVSSKEPVNILLIDISTGLPSFPDIVTQPSGLMIGPPDCSMSIPTDFTAIYKSVTLPINLKTQEY